MKIRIGSRESELALVQARLVADAIRRARPGVETEIVAMKTTGDRILDRSLDAIGGKGLFVKELDAALRAGRVDLCVHSYKDMPTPADPDLPVLAVSRREDPRDVLVPPAGRAEPDFAKPLGSSSQRRRIQLAGIFPGWTCAPVRGNLQTRLRKLDAGEFGGLALAAAGLNRLGLARRAARFFSPDEVVPSACQGILAVQGRAGCDFDFLAAINDRDAWDAARAERAFIEALGGGCTAPTSAYARIDGDALTLTGLHVVREGVVRKDTIAGKRSAADALGTALAERLLSGGDAGDA